MASPRSGSRSRRSWSVPTCRSGNQATGAGGRRRPGALRGPRGGVLRQGIWHHVPRASAHPGGRARARGRPLLAAAMFGLAGLCFFAGVFPGLVMDALSPVVMALTGGARLPIQTTMPCSLWCSERSPQLLQWLARPPFHRVFRVRRRLRDPPLCLACRAARRPGTAAFRMPARSPSTAPAASRS